jgi:hypothetical protein
LIAKLSFLCVSSSEYQVEKACLESGIRYTSITVPEYIIKTVRLSLERSALWN